MLKTINFDFDRFSLTAAAKAILADNARQLLENTEVSVRIEGHCDERGTVEYNLALGERRAIVTRDYNCPPSAKATDCIENNYF